MSSCTRAFTGVSKGTDVYITHAFGGMADDFDLISGTRDENTLLETKLSS